MSHWSYLPFLLIWALPVLALQWLVGGLYLWRERRRWGWIVLGLGVYFSLADGIAIHAGVWRFDNHALLGLWLGPVPLEEIAFYLLTVAMVVQGFVIAWAVLEDPHAAMDRWRAGLRRLRRGGGERYQAGVWAMPLALAPGFALAALFSVPTPLEPLTESVMQLTPVSLANVLLGALGGFARVAALLGAIAITLPIGGLLGLCAPAPVRYDAPAGDTEDVPRWLPWLITATFALVCAIPLAANTPYTAERIAALLSALAFVPALALAMRFQMMVSSRSTLALCSGAGSVDLTPCPPLPRGGGEPEMSSPPVPLSRRGEGESDPKVAPLAPLPLAGGRGGGDEDIQQSAAAAATWLGSPTRRAVLRGLVGSGLTVAACLGLGAYDAWAGALGSLLGRGEVVRALFPFAPPRPRASGFPVAGMEPEVTPAAHFYLLSKNDVDPIVEPPSWYLRVSGAVDHPTALSYPDLTSMPRTDQYLTLRCVNNPPSGHLMSTAYWSGVPLASLLNRAGVQANAVAVKLHAPDGYDEIVPLAAVMGPGALLAYGMNGETLPRRHGGPARALIPGYFGFKNVKWVEAITVLTSVEQGYWARRGWTADQIHSVARIDISRRTAQGMLVAGVAFGGARGVSQVQARVDGGPWQTATLNAPPLSSMSWVQWRVELPMGGGSHTITARMVDGDGAPQIETPSDPQPGGATGLDSVRVEV